MTSLFREGSRVARYPARVRTDRRSGLNRTVASPENARAGIPSAWRISGPCWLRLEAIRRSASSIERYRPRTEPFGSGPHLRDVRFVSPVALFERRVAITEGKPRVLVLANGM